MAQNRLTRFLRNEWIYIVFSVLLVLFPHIVGGITGSSPFGVQRGSRFIMSGAAVYWMSILIDIFALSVLVMSYNLMFGFTGVISFGHAMFFGLGGYLLGMVTQMTGLPPDLAFFVGVALVIVVSAVLGLGIGFATLRLRGVYFAIFTLAVSEMVLIYFGRWAVTGGEDGFALSTIPVWIDAAQSRINLYYVSLILFAGTFVFIRRLVNSPAGAVFKAIRENEMRAQAIGFNTLRFKLLSITIASVLAGCAGIIHALLAKKIGPEMLNVSHTVDALLMTIIGGVGTFTGPILGASGLTLADVLLREATITIGSLTIDIGDSWLLILGLIFVLVVLIFPFGIVGTWNRLRMRFARR
ncbi:MAG: branched-chain amino acid ABC transporter permease [Chloroflexi bacterium]|nr:branched-chain amino acid ABC transporter permease [Chloroflexota bacterium]